MAKKTELPPKDEITGRELAKDFVIHALSFVAICFLGCIFFLMAVMAFAAIVPQMPIRPLDSHDSGLGDHLEYIQKMGGLIGLSVYMIFLVFAYIKKHSKTAIAWLLTAAIEITLLVLSLVNKHLGPPYDVSMFALGVWQFTVLAPLILGYSSIYIKHVAIKSAHESIAITLGIISSILLTIVIIYSLIVLSLSDDGTGKFQGAQKELAQKAIAAQYATYLNPAIGNVIKRYYVHVDYVFPTRPEQADVYCAQRGHIKSDDPNNAQFYSASLSIYEPFAWRATQHVTYDGCYVMNHEVDGHDLSRRQ
jgi:hypothetical protein